MGPCFDNQTPVLGIRLVKPRLKDSVQRSKSALEPAFIARPIPSNESNWCAHQLWGPFKAGWFLGLD